MIELIRDMIGYVKLRRKYFLLPVIVVTLLVGTLVVVTETSAMGTFLYTLF
jgi:hypothetical protein